MRYEIRTNGKTVGTFTNYADAEKEGMAIAAKGSTVEIVEIKEENMTESKGGKVKALLTKGGEIMKSELGKDVMKSAATAIGASIILGFADDIKNKALETVTKVAIIGTGAVVIGKIMFKEERLIKLQAKLQDYATTGKTAEVKETVNEKVAAAKEVAKTKKDEIIAKAKEAVAKIKKETPAEETKAEVVLEPEVVEEEKK